jgi:hypothetical protein
MCYDTNVPEQEGLVLRNKMLAMVPLAICSLSVGAEAFTIKENQCYRQGGWTGFCLVTCDFGMVVTGGGCFTNSEKVGFSANFPSGTNQWACRPAAKAGLVYAYAICQ